MGFWDDSAEGFTDDGRASWEPRIYHFFRRMLRGSICCFCIAFAAFAAAVRVWIHDVSFTLLILVCVFFLAVLASLTGLILSAPTRKKRKKSKSSDDWSQETRRRL